MRPTDRQGWVPVRPSPAPLWTATAVPLASAASTAASAVSICRGVGAARSRMGRCTSRNENRASSARSCGLSVEIDQKADALFGERRERARGTWDTRNRGRAPRRANRPGRLSPSRVRMMKRSQARRLDTAMAPGAKRRRYRISRQCCTLERMALTKQRPGAEQRVDPSEMQRRLQLAEETILTDERLRGGLTDEQFAEILQWALPLAQQGGRLHGFHRGQRRRGGPHSTSSFGSFAARFGKPCALPKQPPRPSTHRPRAVGAASRHVGRTSQRLHRPRKTALAPLRRAPATCLTPLHSAALLSRRTSPLTGQHTTAGSPRVIAKAAFPSGKTADGPPSRRLFDRPRCAGALLVRDGCRRRFLGSSNAAAR
ncbi:MAG: hypothetical protein KatS3mg060_2705 [Dehalococcoidia bacterium]|nr:MAG: hypothetical protein KatS3mg060_2705 [Dehalococcoidia bacterium]